MQTVQRSGVEFDICPSCRGVWLDRGELEKMLATAREGMADVLPSDTPPPQQSGSPATTVTFTGAAGLG